MSIYGSATSGQHHRLRIKIRYFYPKSMGSTACLRKQRLRRKRRRSFICTGIMDSYLVRLINYILWSLTPTTLTADPYIYCICQCMWHPYGNVWWKPTFLHPRFKWRLYAIAIWPRNMSTAWFPHWVQYGLPNRKPVVRRLETYLSLICI